MHIHPHPERRRGRRNHHREPELSGLHRFFGHGRGGRSVRRGNVRVAILAALRDESMHGYHLIQELEKRTGGRWRPSAGSIYPTLQLLEEEGLLTSREVDGRRTFSLSDAGRSAVEARPMGERWPGDEPYAGADLRRLAMSVVAAAKQVERIGSPEAVESACEVLTDARKRLYRLLAEDEAGTESQDASSQSL